MKAHEPISILSVGEISSKPLEPLITSLCALPHVQVQRTAGLPAALPDIHIVLTHGAEGLAKHEVRLADYVKGGGTWFHFIGRSESQIPDLFGVQPGPLGPETELRILYTDRDNPMAEGLTDAFYVPEAFQELHPKADDVVTDLYADWHYSHRSMVVHRPVGQGHTACTTLQGLDHPDVQRIIYRLVRWLAGRPFGKTLGVGILGYAPSVGRLHGLGCDATRGLALKAACDLSPDRLAQANRDFPGVSCVTSGSALAEDPDIDLVIVATQPNTHAELCVQMMTTGKHVICEKPPAAPLSDSVTVVSILEAAARSMEKCGSLEMVHA